MSKVTVRTYQLCIGTFTQIGDKYAVAHLDVLAIDDHDAQEALLAHLNRARLGELIKDEFRLQMWEKLKAEQAQEWLALARLVCGCWELLDGLDAHALIVGLAA